MSSRFTNIWVILFSLIMFSCGEEDMTTAGDTSLQGTWKAISLDGTVVSESSFMGNILLSDSEITGNNFDYILTLTNDNKFVTSGSYDIELSTVVQGNVLVATDSYDNVSGNGTYTSTETDIVLDGSIFDFSINGVPVEVSGGELPATYSISNGIMTVTETKDEITNTNGVMASTQIDMVSVWQKQ